MSDKLTLRLFGPPQIVVDEVPLKEPLLSKAQAILFFLATAGHPQSRTTLAGLLWGDMTEETARTNLRKALAELRQSLADFVLIDRQTVSLRTERRLEVDVVEFMEKIDLRSEAVDFAALEAAIGLYQGDFLAGFQVRNAPDFENWLYTEQARLREMVVQALHLLSGQYARLGDTTRGIGYVRQLLALEPWREEAHRQLIDLLARDGQRGAALAQYEICRQTLAEELGVEPGPELIALYERIKAGEIIGVNHKTAVGSRNQLESKIISHAEPENLDLPLRRLHNLPSQPTPFVGRKQELAEIAARLRQPDCRLLTLIGPGGIGKTRLSIQAAQLLLDAPSDQHDLAHGIFFVALTPVESVDGLISAVAAAIGFQFYGHASPKEQMLAYLQEKDLLLILDNFEQLLPTASGQAVAVPDDSAVELVSEILAAAPAVKLLVTSREALNLQEAWFHPVAAMSFPDSRQAEQDQSLAEYDAVRLFVQNARRVQVSFDLDAVQDEVLRICRLVGGMPLGIELAAAWLKVLPPQKIAAELEHNLDVLTTRMQNVPARHRSMRAVFDHAWQRLSSTEQAVLCRLSVFRGPFDQEAAAQVAEASLLSLATLVEKSLLHVTDRGRYQLHELLRQFAAQLLADMPVVLATTHQLHSAYFLEFLADQAEALNGPAQQAALVRMGEEVENIRVGWQWAVGQAYWAAIDQALSSLFEFYDLQGRFQEGLTIFSEAVEQLHPFISELDELDCQAILSRLKIRLASFYGSLGDIEGGKVLALEILPSLSQPADHVFILNLLGNTARVQGERARAADYYQQSLTLSRTHDLRFGLADGLRGLSDLFSSFGDYSEGRRWAIENLAVCRTLGRPDKIAKALATLAWSLNCVGAYEEALQYYRESLAISEQIGDRYGIAMGVNFVGWSLWCLSPEYYGEAKAHCEQALTIWRDIGFRVNQAMCLGDLTLITNDMGLFEEALRCGQEALTITQDIKATDLMTYVLYGLGSVYTNLGDWSASRHHLRRSVQLAWDHHIPDHTVNALVLFAGLLAQESERAVSSEFEQQQKRLKALELVFFAQSQPVCWQIYKDRAARLEAVLTANQSTDVLSTVWSHSQNQTLDQVVTQFLAEVEPA